jgi:phage/plasmid primase-like uncharacterized protein
MIGAVQNVTGHLLGVHRTYLEWDGIKRVDKRMLGRVRGGAVRLSSAGEELAVAEGIETALSVLQATGRRTWAALSAAGLIALELPPLPIAASVLIAADHDQVGLEAAQHLAKRLVLEGRRIRIAKPPKPGTDFNDLLRGVG